MSILEFIGKHPILTLCIIYMVGGIIECIVEKIVNRDK